MLAYILLPMASAPVANVARNKYHSFSKNLYNIQQCSQL